MGDGGDRVPDGSLHQLLRAVLTSAPIAVLLSRLDDHRIIDANPAACRFLGRSGDELLGTTVDEITAAGDLDATIGHFDARTAMWVADKWYVRGDGSFVPGRVHAIQVPEVPELGAALIVDTSDLVATRERLELISEISRIIARPIGSDDGLAERTREVEQLVADRLGWTLEILWDRGGSFEERPHAVGRRVTEPIEIDGRRIGALLAVVPTQQVGATDRAFVATMARSIANVHVVHELRHRLEAAALFESGFERTQVGMEVVALDGTLLRVNEAFARMLGGRPDELVGTNWRDHTHPDDIEATTRGERAALADDPPQHVLKRYLRLDGGIAWARMTGTLVDVGDREPVHLIHVVDVTTEVAAQQELADSERRYRSLVEPSVDLVLRLDLHLRVVDGNASAVRALGASREEIIGRSVRPYLPSTLLDTLGAYVRDVAESGRQAESWRHFLELADRAPGWYVVRVIPERPDADGRVDHVHVVASDVTELVESEQRLTAMALVDPLTGVSNRAAVFDRLRHALDCLDRDRDGGVALVMLDLDHFKAVNDTYGHANGDEVLRSTARRLRTAIRNQDTLGRLGGDEFVVISEDVPGRAEAHELSERLADALRDTVAELDPDLQVPISASIGVTWTDRSVPVEDLVARADQAMYEAKRHGRDRTWLEQLSDDAVASPSSSELLRHLNLALRDGQFRLHYQPIVDVVTGEAVAVEALLRWQHPQWGLLTPDRFLGALLSTGQIGPVGQWVVRTAIEQLARWSGEHVRVPQRVHVNATPAELADPRLTRLLRDESCRLGVDPRRVCIELTEQALASSVVSASALRDIAELGVQLVLDDFGTGVSSLTHLRTRPLHGLKIDRTFIAGAGADPGDQAIVESVIGLAAGMGIDAVAEGVETAEQSTWLREAGCRYAQGWLFARAMDADDLVDWMDRHAA